MLNRDILANMEVTVRETPNVYSPGLIIQKVFKECNWEISVSVTLNLKGMIERDIIKQPMQITNKKNGWPNCTTLVLLFLRVHVKKYILVTEAIAPNVITII